MKFCGITVDDVKIDATIENKQVNNKKLNEATIDFLQNFPNDNISKHMKVAYQQVKRLKEQGYKIVVTAQLEINHYAKHFSIDITLLLKDKLIPTLQRKVGVMYTPIDYVSFGYPSEFTYKYGKRLYDVVNSIKGVMKL